MEVKVPTPEEYKAYLDKNPHERANIRCKYGRPQTGMFQQDWLMGREIIPLPSSFGRG